MDSSTDQSEKDDYEDEENSDTEISAEQHGENIGEDLIPEQIIRKKISQVEFRLLIISNTLFEISVTNCFRYPLLFLSVDRNLATFITF